MARRRQRLRAPARLGAVRCVVDGLPQVVSSRMSSANELEARAGLYERAIAQLVMMRDELVREGAGGSIDEKLARHDRTLAVMRALLAATSAEVKVRRWRLRPRDSGGGAPATVQKMPVRPGSGARPDEFGEGRMPATA